MEATAIFERNLRRFTFESFKTIKVKKQPNLWEMISRYPNRGQNFLVRRKDWPENRYFQVYKIKNFGPSNGRSYGFYYQDQAMTKLEEKKLLKLKYTLQRSHWNYIPSDESVTLDNGVEYDQGKYNQLIKEKEMFRKQMKLGTAFINSKVE
mmetsp:Transcript_8743/g.9922  ORF Transcript_8743/g.9922 Transcript_8743/m.9922 type:complete len:151 (-) Transcript_8743:34-486(-)